MDLIEKKCAAHLDHLHYPQCTTKKYALTNIRRTVQFKLRKMQDSWLSARADDIQGSADKIDLKNFYSSLKEVYGTTNAGLSPPLSAHGTKLKWENNKILEKWAERFDGVLNKSSSINYKAIERMTQVPVNESLDITSA